MGQTVMERAEEAYPNRNYDTALPQQWVNSMAERGFDVRGHFVTLYPKSGDNQFGFYMAPITPEGVEMAARVASMHG